MLKSLPVQSSLLLLPLIALAGLRWRDHLIWATTELAYFVGVWLYIAGASAPNRGLPAGFYLVLLLARLGGHRLAGRRRRSGRPSTRSWTRCATPARRRRGRGRPGGRPATAAPEDRLVVELA